MGWQMLTAQICADGENDANGGLMVIHHSYDHANAVMVLFFMIMVTMEPHLIMRWRYVMMTVMM